MSTAQIAAFWFEVDEEDEAEVELTAPEWSAQTLGVSHLAQLATLQLTQVPSVLLIVLPAGQVQVLVETRVNPEAQVVH